MNHEIGGWLWLIMDVGFVLVLGGALVYGSIMWRKWRRHPERAAERDRATRDAYEER